VLLPGEPDVAPLSLTAYAKRRGVSAVAVSKAVASGRLSASVVRDERGAPKIGDPELADREWTANTRPRIDHPPEASPSAAPARPRAAARELPASGAPPAASSAPRPAPAAAAAAAAPPPPRRPLLDDVPDYHESRARREAAAARRESALADVAELDAGERKGELVSVAEARADVIEMFSIARTKLLGLPARLAQRLPHLAAEVVPVLDGLLREALEELAEDGDGEEEDGT
jgi:hypothetical protein